MGSKLVKKMKKLTLYSMVYFLLFIMLSTTPTALITSTHHSPNMVSGAEKKESGDYLNYSHTATKGENNHNMPISLEVRDSEVGSSYSAVNDVEGVGDNFTVKDYFTLNQNENVNVSYQYTATNAFDQRKGSFNIFAPNQYENVSLRYNITSIKAQAGYYIVENDTDYSSEKLTTTTYNALAQGFQVQWDYAVFYGAKVYLDLVDSGALGTYELDLFLVSAKTTSPYEPNMSNIIAYSLEGPFNATNTLPLSSDKEHVHYFPFQTVTLSKGRYYIVANLSKVDTNDDGTNRKHYAWYKKPGVPYGDKSWVMDTVGSWFEQPYDFYLVVRLMASYNNGSAYQFSSPSEVDLKDNGVSIDSNSVIYSIGTHYLFANTSVIVSLNNPYSFRKYYDATSHYIGTNSTFNSETINWNVTWTTPEVDYSPYVNFNRIQDVYTPKDWGNTFSFLYNDTNTMTGTRETFGYRLSLGSNNTAAEWKLKTTSPNHLYSATFSDGTEETDRYFLGYWSTNSTHAIGHNGSTIIVDAIVGGQYGTYYNDTSGTFNFTLFDSDGKIVPLKTSLPANLSFTDVTYYTVSTTTQISEGYYQQSITFDPSVYGSDKPGFWTAYVRWSNGTEVGIYSIRIVVQTQTTFEAQWEVEPGVNTWTSDNIARRSDDSISIKAEYYNISEPFFSGKGHAIPNANVSYETQWSRTGTFNDYHPLYNTSVLVDTAVGNYSVTIIATGAFLENHSITFYVSVFYQLSIEFPSYDSYATNYTNHAYYYFCLYDVNAGANLSTTPDDIIVRVSNSTDTIDLTQNVDYTFTYQAVTEQWKLDIDTSIKNFQTGTYNVSVAVYINDYRGSYTDQYARYTFTLNVTEPKTDINVVNADSTIYIYSTATINFSYVDTNHTLNIHGATVTPWSNATGVSISWTEDSGVYILTIEVTNSDLAKVWIFINVTASNYEPISNYLVGTLDVLINNAELLTTQQPQNITVDHGFYVIVYYNDTTHNSEITGASLDSYTCNGSITLTLISFVENGNGYYNITFIVSDPNFDTLNITIILRKAGYEDGIVFILLNRVDVPTSASITGNNSDTIYYLEGTTFTLLYIDMLENDNISSTNVNLYFTGNLTSAADITWHWNDNVYYIDINNAYAVGYFELSVYIIRSGYKGQTLVFTIIINIRTTSTDYNSIEESYYADQTAQITVSYYDALNGSSLISNGEINYVFVNGSTAYFEEIKTIVVGGTTYQITFNPYEINATGLTFLVNITLYKYGYEEQVITLTLHILIRPTSITTETTEITIYTTQSAIFTFYYYYDTSTTLITGADISVVSLNGTVYISTLNTFSNSTGYYLYIQPNILVSAGVTLYFNVTLYKAGCVSQHAIVKLTVLETPTTASTETQEIRIFANQNAIISISYTDNLTSQPITLANVQITINGTEYLTSEPSYSYNIQTQRYDILIDFNDQLVAGKVFLVNITIHREGYQLQNLIIYIHVYPKIKFNLTLFIVEGFIQQLNTFRFQVNLTEAELLVLGLMDVPLQYDPRGEKVEVEYTFLYSDGSNETKITEISINYFDSTTSTYYGQSGEIFVPWKVSSMAVAVKYNPSESSTVENISTELSFSDIASPALSSLIVFFFQHYTAYMATGLSIIVLILILLIIYLAIIRPKKQKKELEHKRYLDKVSKIVSSVISMRKIIVVHKETSVPVFEWDFGSQITVDSSLVTGFLQAVSGMAGELSGVSNQTVKKIDYHNFVVNSSVSENYITYLFSTTDISKDVEKGLSNFIQWFERMFHAEGKNWDGTLDRFKSQTRKIIDRISEDLYVWTLYPLSVNPMKEAEVIKLDRLSQKIIKFIKETKEAPISLILEYFKDLPVEETLSLIFALVDNQFLLRKRLR